MRVFFSSGLAFIFPLRRENSGKNRSGRENKRSENMKFRHIAPRWNMSEISYFPIFYFPCSAKRRFFGWRRWETKTSVFSLRCNIVIVHLGQYWRFYFPCFFGTRGGRSPTPSAKRTGRKTNNIARGAHIAYCTEGKTRVFQQSAMKSGQKTKIGEKNA